MNEKRQEPFVNIGSSSLLVVFLTLCLVTFAVLSLSSARSDYTFSEKLSQRRTAYYEASNRAEDILDAVDAALSSSEGREAKLEAVRALSSEEYPELSEASLSEDAVSWQVPVSDQQTLQVTLSLTEDSYEIQAWQLVTTAQWEADDDLQLLPINTLEQE